MFALLGLEVLVLMLGYAPPRLLLSQHGEGEHGDAEIHSSLVLRIGAWRWGHRDYRLHTLLFTLGFGLLICLSGNE